MSNFATIATMLHAVAAVIWVGGMFFAYVVLRPATGALEPPAPLKLWAAVLPRFFPWGTWIRTRTIRVRAGGSTVNLSPKTPPKRWCAGPPFLSHRARQG